MSMKEKLLDPADAEVLPASARNTAHKLELPSLTTFVDSDAEDDDKDANAVNNHMKDPTSKGDVSDDDNDGSSSSSDDSSSQASEFETKTPTVWSNIFAIFRKQLAWVVIGGTFVTLGFVLALLGQQYSFLSISVRVSKINIYIWMVWIGITFSLLPVNKVVTYLLFKLLLKHFSQQSDNIKSEGKSRRQRKWKVLFYFLPIESTFRKVLLILFSFIAWVLLLYFFHFDNDDKVDVSEILMLENGDSDFEIELLLWFYRVFLCLFIAHSALLVENISLRVFLSKIYLKKYFRKFENLAKLERNLCILLNVKNIFMPNLTHFLVTYPSHPQPYKYFQSDHLSNLCLVTPDSASAPKPLSLSKHEQEHTSTLHHAHVHHKLDSSTQMPQTSHHADRSEREEKDYVTTILSNNANNYAHSSLAMSHHEASVASNTSASDVLLPAPDASSNPNNANNTNNSKNFSDIWASKIPNGAAGASTASVGFSASPVTSGATGNNAGTVGGSTWSLGAAASASGFGLNGFNFGSSVIYNDCKPEMQNFRSRKRRKNVFISDCINHYSQQIHVPLWFANGQAVDRRKIGQIYGNIVFNTVADQLNKLNRDKDADNSEYSHAPYSISKKHAHKRQESWRSREAGMSVMGSVGISQNYEQSFSTLNSPMARDVNDSLGSPLHTYSREGSVGAHSADGSGILQGHLQGPKMRNYFVEADFMKLFKKYQDKKVFSPKLVSKFFQKLKLSKNDENRIYPQEVQQVMQIFFSNVVNLRSQFDSLKDILKSLQRAGTIYTHFFLVFFYLLLFNFSFESALSIYVSMIGVGVIFGSGPITRLINGVTLIFGISAYNVGDVIVVNGSTYIVLKITLLTTVMKNVYGIVYVWSNNDLLDQISDIINLSAQNNYSNAISSKTQPWHKLVFYVSYETTGKQVDKVVNKFKKFILKDAELRVLCSDAVIKTIMDLDQFMTSKVIVSVQSYVSFGNNALRWRIHSKLYDGLRTILRELDIKPARALNLVKNFDVVDVLDR